LPRKKRMSLEETISKEVETMCNVECRVDALMIFLHVAFRDIKGDQLNFGRMCVGDAARVLNPVSAFSS
jgi:hypothetical protein